MNRLLKETNAMQYKCYLTGSNNFRYDIYPDYKANRKDAVKPRHLEVVREHLVSSWKAVVTDGIEADDAMGIDQCNNDDTIIITIDKDLWMIPGRHYAFATSGTSSLGKKWEKPAEFRLISPLEGLRNFYTQLIMGDRADNVPGYDGKMRVKVPQFLQPVLDQLNECKTEEEMYFFVKSIHQGDMLTYGKCLWIQRKENDIWNPTFDKEKGMDGSKAESIHHFSAPSGE